MKVFYPGSFNPFTIGHLDIVARALRVADEVIIGIGINPDKTTADDSRRRFQNLERLFEKCPRVSVTIYSGLTIEAARRSGASLIIRGFRNSIDAEFERNLATTNLLISGNPDLTNPGSRKSEIPDADKESRNDEVDTWIIPARPELECISSSMVNELKRFGHPVEAFLPTPGECERKCNC